MDHTREKLKLVIFMKRYSTHFVVLSSVLLITLALFLFLKGIYSPVEKIPDVVAMVNGKKITAGGFKEKLNLLKNIYLKFYDLQDFKSADGKILLNRMHSKVLDDLITEEVLLQEAEKSGIEVSSDEVEHEFRAIASNNKMTKSELIEHLRNHGINLDAYIKRIKNQMIIKKIAEKELFDETSENTSNNYSKWLKNRIRASDIEIYYEVTKPSDITERCCRQ